MTNKTHPEASKRVYSHIWKRETNEHYVEPAWCSERLFDTEEFIGTVHDPCCGFGTISKSAISAGLFSSSSDIINRGYPYTVLEDFLKTETIRDNIIFNPPFNKIKDFILHAIKCSKYKTAVIFPIARLNAANWLINRGLCRVYLLTPRPSMPPGYVITSGQKAQGGKVDFCWLVFLKDYVGNPEIIWLHRDKEKLDK